MVAKGVVLRSDREGAADEAASFLSAGALPAGRSPVPLYHRLYVVPADEVRERLRLGTGEAVQRAVRVRRLDGVPLSQSTTFVLERVGRAFGAADLATTPLIDLIERAGVRVGSAEQSITAVLAD